MSSNMEVSGRNAHNAQQRRTALCAPGLWLSPPCGATPLGCAVPIKSSDGYVNIRQGPGAEYSIVARVVSHDLLVTSSGTCADPCLCDKSSKWVFVDSVSSKEDFNLISPGWINARHLRSVPCD
jgi:hypothetical protein